MREFRRLAHIHLPQQWEPEQIVREGKESVQLTLRSTQSDAVIPVVVEWGTP